MFYFILCTFIVLHSLGSFVYCAEQPLSPKQQNMVTMLEGYKEVPHRISEQKLYQLESTEIARLFLPEQSMYYLYLQSIIRIIQKDREDLRKYCGPLKKNRHPLIAAEEYSEENQQYSVKKIHSASNNEETIKKISEEQQLFIDQVERCCSMLHRTSLQKLTQCKDLLPLLFPVREYKVHNESLTYTIERARIDKALLSLELLPSTPLSDCIQALINLKRIAHAYHCRHTHAIFTYFIEQLSNASLEGIETIKDHEDIQKELLAIYLLLFEFPLPHTFLVPTIIWKKKEAESIMKTYAVDGIEATDVEMHGWKTLIQELSDLITASFSRLSIFHEYVNDLQETFKKLQKKQQEKNNRRTQLKRFIESNFIEYSSDIELFKKMKEGSINNKLDFINRQMILLYPHDTPERESMRNFVEQVRLNQRKVCLLEEKMQEKYINALFALRVLNSLGRSNFSTIEASRYEECKNYLLEGEADGTLVYFEEAYKRFLQWKKENL